jgi:hypothetical protein
MPEEASIPSFASREVIPVRVLLSAGLQVEGSVHISVEPNRFSDAWEEMMRDPRSYVAITESETRSAEDGTLEEMDGFLLIRKSDIIAVRPINEK